MYYLAEYVIYVAAAGLLGVLLFAATAVLVLSGEGAKRLASGSRTTAGRTLRAVEASTGSATALISRINPNANRV